MLQSVISELEGRGLVEESEGCKVVFLEGFKARDGVSRFSLSYSLYLSLASS